METTEDLPHSGTSHEFATEYREQLDRLLRSDSFRDTPSSRRLLRYIGARSLEGDQQNLKEFVIGVEALGRRSDFDPKTDTIVRVQVRRLRQKITQYYETEGFRDPVVITIPKGSYAAEFTLRAPLLDENAPGMANEVVERSHVIQAAFTREQSQDSSVQKPTRRFRLSAALALVIAAILAGAIVGLLVSRRVHLHTTADPTAVDQLWTSMLKGDESPIIGYPDAVFLLDGASDMFQFNEGPVGTRGELVDPNVARKYSPNPTLIANAGPLYYESGGYTGTGEIESIAALSVLLNRLGFHPKIMRSHEITVDELRTHNVILLGGSGQNKAVKDFLTRGDFEYDYTPRAWGGRVINHNPLSGEAHEFHIERDPATSALNGDYALVSCLPGVNPLHHIITLGGLDTTGTLGATLFATSDEGAEKLTEQLHHKLQDPYFQSIIHVLLAHGNQVFHTELAAIHTKQEVQTRMHMLPRAEPNSLPADLP